jgi:hypothetical protein
MLHYWSEPSLAETLLDPVVQAVMAADAVDPAALDALLREVARRVGPRLRPWATGAGAMQTAAQRRGGGSSGH